MSFPRRSAGTLRRDDVQIQLPECVQHCRPRVTLSSHRRVSPQLAVTVSDGRPVLVDQRAGLIHAVESAQSLFKQESRCLIVQVEFLMQSGPPAFGSR